MVKHRLQKVMLLQLLNSSEEKLHTVYIYFIGVGIGPKMAVLYRYGYIRYMMVCTCLTTDPKVNS